MELEMSNPAAYVRSDNVNAVVYLAADNHIHEINIRTARFYFNGDIETMPLCKVDIGVILPGVRWSTSLRFAFFALDSKSCL